MELKEDFQDIYNYTHPHIENIDEDSLKKVVVSIYSTLTGALDSNEIELSYIKNLIESNDLNIKDGKFVVILEDDLLSYGAEDTDNDELMDEWKKSSDFLMDKINCDLNWNADGYFYLRDNEFMNNCIKLKSKTDIFEVLASNLDNKLESLISKYQVAFMKEDKKEIIEDIIRENSDNGDISKFFSFSNSSIPSILSYTKYSLRKAMEQDN